MAADFTIDTGPTKWPVLDQDGAQLTTGNSTVFPDVPNKVGVEFSTGLVYLFGIAPTGTTPVNVTATRLSDGATFAHTVEVTAPALPPFSWTLGSPVPR